jgi:hypothetical protein
MMLYYLQAGVLPVQVIPTESFAPPPPTGAGMAQGGLHYYEMRDFHRSLFINIF